MSDVITYYFAVDDGTIESLRVSRQTIQAREDEMHQTAQKLGVVGSKWCGSLLYTEHRKAPSNASHTFDCRGKHWLTAFTLRWILAYYETGMLHIPKEAHGYSVLAALEYFCILYSPDQCHFADFHVYERVQMWARYLSHREALADSLRDSEFTFFGVTPSACERMDLGTTEIAPLGGTELANFCYRLFQRQDQEKTVKELRDDFCQHVSCVVGPAKFSVKPVTIYTPATKVVNRAVLTVHRREARRRQLVFMLPDELDKETPDIVVKVDDNTVTSGLTGPFYTDTTGHVKDIFEHEEAKRHEWVQTALMNRGITERMEKLLNPKEETKQPEIWEWFSGLGMCDMSRSVVEGWMTKERRSTPPPPIVTLDVRPPSRVKDRIKELTAEFSDKKDCDSKESPRGVADYYCYQDPPKRIQPIVEEAKEEAKVEEVREDPPVHQPSGASPPPPPPPKKKGLLGLFRRRKEEA